MGRMRNSIGRNILVLAALAAIFFGGGFWLRQSLRVSQEKLAREAFLSLPGQAQELLIQLPGEKIGGEEGDQGFMSKLQTAETRPTEDNKEPLPPHRRERGGEEMGVQTAFAAEADEVSQTVAFKNGRETQSFKMSLKDSAGYQHGVYPTDNGDVMVYQGENETLAYTQSKDPEKGTIQLKELIYAQKPNQDGRSHYVWDFSANNGNAKITLEKQPDGQVFVYSEMQIQGVAPEDTAQQQHVKDVVKQALGDVAIQGRQQVAAIQPPFYLAQDGSRHELEYSIDGAVLTLDIAPAPDAYPLTIDPTLIWLQWLTDEMFAVSEIEQIIINGDEIYIGGRVNNVSSLALNPTYVGGTPSGIEEGFVVELQDNPSSAPTLNWLQWLGGAGNDSVYGLAVNGDEIYAGGRSMNGSNWESADYNGGTFAGSEEGFVVELQDNPSSAPTINWRQWLGGDDYDDILTLAVNGDEIYASGSCGGSSNWESATYTGGALAGSDEGFVVELQDNASAAPTINWRQWLGGAAADYIYAVAVNGDEIYAGGNSNNSSSWESATYTGGTFAGSSEDFVVELQDNASAAPTLNWRQWLGSGMDDDFYALAVNGDEIYAGGYAYDSSFESATYVGGTGSDGEGFVVELQDNASAAPTINWLQWLGGSSWDEVHSLAVDSDEIYVVGWSQSENSWESATYTGGTFHGVNEGFVVELQDNASAAPTINWRQWLGKDVVCLAASPDEIYATSSAIDETDPETAMYTGGTYYIGSPFVIELVDIVDATPDFNWLQWISWHTYARNFVLSIKVNGDEIYAGGYSEGDTGKLESIADYVGGEPSSGFEGFVLELQDNASAAPTINWLQWLGGSGNDYVHSITFDGEEIYAGGQSNSSVGWESATYTGGTASSLEGFVVELQDNASAAPTLNWLQWLGGSGLDDISEIVLNGDEIYAGGYSYSSSDWEPATYTGGTFAGSVEAFVLELQDNASAAPTINWFQWLGGSGNDSVGSIAINGDEVYAVGDTDSSTSWESGTYNGGTYSGGEGFVVELQDNASAAPTLNWRQWLGGSGNENLYSIAVNNDEIYVGGRSYNSGSWEPFTYTGGSFAGTSEGFVVELQDNASAAPTLNWRQWLGGMTYDYVSAVTFNDDEIYVVGSSDSGTGWESFVSSNGYFLGYSEGFVVELQDNASAAPTLNWLQWVGGDDDDLIYGIALDGDEIFVGGDADMYSNFETALFTDSSGEDSFTNDKAIILKILDIMPTKALIRGGVKMRGGVTVK